MRRVRRRWRYIGWAALAVTAFWLALVVIEVAGRV